MKVAIYIDAHFELQDYIDEGFAEIDVYLGKHARFVDLYGNGDDD